MPLCAFCWAQAQWSEWPPHDGMLVCLTCAKPTWAKTMRLVTVGRTPGHRVRPAAEGYVCDECVKAQRTWGRLTDVIPYNERLLSAGERLCRWEVDRTDQESSNLDCEDWPSAVGALARAGGEGFDRDRASVTSERALDAPEALARYLGVAGKLRAYYGAPTVIPSLLDTVRWWVMIHLCDV